MSHRKNSNNTIELQIATCRFNVLKFSGAEALTKPFRFELEVLAPHDFMVDHYLLKPATINLHYAGYRRFIVGIITQIKTATIDLSGQQRICFMVESRLALLAQRQRERRLYNQSYPQVIKKLLCEYGYLAEQIKFHFSKPQHAEQQSSIAQYPAETDLDFLHRVLAQQGLFYWLSCDQATVRETIHITDANSNLAWFPDVLSDVPASELATTRPGLVALTSHYHYHAHRYRVVGHDAAFPTRHINACYQHDANATLSQVTYAADVANAEQAQQRAILLAEQGGQRQQQHCAESNVPQFSAGLCFNFHSNGCYQSLNGAYVATQVQHHAEQSIEHVGKQLLYHNQLWLTPQAVPYRGALASHATPHACSRAIVKSTGTHPELDQQGRYRLHFCCNHTGNTTEFVPRLTHSGGVAQYIAGVHTPLYNDVDVLTGFLNGDAKQPVILGAIANGHLPTL